MAVKKVAVKKVAAVKVTAAVKEGGGGDCMCVCELSVRRERI